MTNRIWVVLFFVFFFTSCKSKSESDTKKIYIDLKRMHIEKIEDIIEKIDTIFLEANTISLIGSITKISFFENNIYICDSQHNKLLVFSENGTFLNNIGMKGRAGNEFIGINDFFIHNDTIFLYDFNGQKILKFRKDGSHIHTSQLEHSFNLIQLLPNNRGYIVLNTYGNKKVIPKFSWLDYNFKERYSSFEQRLNGSNLNNSFFQYGTFLVYWELLNDTIYSVTDKEVTPKYVVDFMNYAMPSNITDIPEMTEYYINNSSKVAGFINNVIETDKVVAFMFGYDKASYWALIDKKRNNTRIFRLTEVEDFFGKLNYIATFHNGWFYGVYMPDELNINNNPSLIRFKISEP